jgi:hypothetical protein
MNHLTPEQRKIATAKGIATRKANREKREAVRAQAQQYADGLGEKIAELENKLLLLQTMETMNTVSCKLQSKTLIKREDIVKASISWQQLIGVYFLIDKDEVVYVGQSVNIYSRIGQHSYKKFDRYAFIPCEASSLNTLESLYIHFLQPKLNANIHGQMHAPFPLNKLLKEAA